MNGDAVELEPTLWGARVGAALVDLVVRFGILVVAGSLAELALILLGAEGGAREIVSASIGLLVAQLYEPVSIATWHGLTVGHKTLDTRIVTADGGQLGFGRAFVREFLVKFLLIDVLGILTLGILPIVNYIRPIWNDEGLALHDSICGTKVVWAPQQD